jgi:hypothetical protein
MAQRGANAVPLDEVEPKRIERDEPRAWTPSRTMGNGNARNHATQRPAAQIDKTSHPRRASLDPYATMRSLYHDVAEM